MNRGRSGVGLIVCVSVAATLAAAGDAHACRYEPLPGAPRDFDPCEASRTNLFLLTIGGGLSIPSLLTNVELGFWYGSTRAIPLAWAVVGTSVWAAHTGVASASLALSVRSSDTTAIALSSTYLAVSLASLAPSLWAFSVLRRPAPLRAVSIAPWRSVDASGLLVTGTL